MNAIAIVPCVVLALGGAILFEDAYPRYAVAPDTALKRAYTSTTKLESEPAQMFLDGEELPTEGRGELRLRVEDRRTLEVIDTVGAAADGRPTRFTREYVELENAGTETVVAKPPKGEEESRAQSRDRVSPLTGRSVRFAWDGGKDEYVPTFVGESDEKAKARDAELLERLEADAEWLPLLADGPREKGAKFALDPKVLQRAQYPLGELHWYVEGKEPDPVSLAITIQLAENLDGKAEATWRGTEEVDGRKLGVYAISAQLKSKASAETPDGGETREVDLELEYEGEVRWDLAAGRVDGYELKADVRSVLSTTREVDGPNGKAKVRQVFDLRGQSQHELAVTSG